ncbi:MAG: RNA polymerase sigma factor [Planctomycetaceae bacterium]
MASMDDPANDLPDSIGSQVGKSPEELIRTHQAGLWRYLRMLGCDASLADDLTQEAFLKVLRRESFMQHSDSATAAYLRRTAHNLLVSLHRKGGRKKTTVTSDPLDEIWDRWAGRDLSGDFAVDSLRECLQSLTDRAQLALRMRFADDASRAAIAEALGITEHGARNLMQRAKQQLKECVQEKLREHDAGRAGKPRPLPYDQP